MTKALPSAVVAALILLLAALTATAALADNGNGSGHGGGGWVPPNQAKTLPPLPLPVPLPAPLPLPVPATPVVTPATPPGQATKDPAAGTPMPRGQRNPSAGATTVAAGQGPATATATATTGTTGTATAVAPAVPPVLGRSMAVTPVAGTVQVRLPSGTGYVALADAGSIPSGTTIDARAGRLELKTAVAGGRTQSATFWGAVFEIRQARGARGMTDIVLKGGRPAGCPAARSALGRMASLSLGSGRTAAGTRSAGLWAKDKRGRFRSRGRNSVATVRGTRWLTRETCAGTLTRVAEGAVAVRDTRRHKTVLVRAGHSYLARDAR